MQRLATLAYFCTYMLNQLCQHFVDMQNDSSRISHVDIITGWHIFLILHVGTELCHHTIHPMTLISFIWMNLKIEMLYLIETEQA